MTLQASARGVVAVLDGVVGAEGAAAHATQHNTHIHTRETHAHASTRRRWRRGADNSDSDANTPSGHHLRDDGPLVAVNLVLLEYDFILLWRPRALLHVGPEVVVPPERAGQSHTDTQDSMTTSTRRHARAHATHRSRHCLPVRPGRWGAMSDHDLPSMTFMTSRSFASSCTPTRT